MFDAKKPRCSFGASGAVKELRDCQIENDSRWHGENRSTRHLNSIAKFLDDRAGKIGSRKNEENENIKTIERQRKSGDNPHFYSPTRRNFPVERLK